MSSSPDNLRARGEFLTDSLIKELSASNDQKKDYFTASENYPRAFRVGQCSADSAEKVTLQVVLLWRSDARSEQKEVSVEAVKTGGKWLIEKVFS